MDDLIKSHLSVGSGIGEGCSSQSDTLVGSVEDGVESLEKSLAIDEVKSLTTWRPNVGNNQINVVGNTTNQCVEVTRPDLSVRSQTE